MNSEKITEKYIAFLRGINVGGHHKVPMANLHKVFENIGFQNIITLLNSGNIIFNTISQDNEELEELISSNLEKIFGFPIPTIVRKSQTIYQLYIDAPFKDVIITNDIRLYISFLKKNNESDIELPWVSADKSYKIIESKNKIILSILDVSISKTPKAMIALEKSFGKDITTRNWKTIERIYKKL